MIGVSEISPALNRGGSRGYRLRSVDSLADVADGRYASCRAMAEILNRQWDGSVMESILPYGRNEPCEFQSVDRECSMDKNISRIGDLITYLEGKYDF